MHTTCWPWVSVTQNPAPQCPGQLQILGLRTRPALCSCFSCPSPNLYTHLKTLRRPKPELGVTIAAPGVPLIFPTITPGKHTDQIPGPKEVKAILSYMEASPG